METDKPGLLSLAKLMKARGIKHLVVSPGSRNAPVVSVFCNDPFFDCLVIVDERSAAFFALGMALSLQQAVAIVCTSGSAALNYAPAVAEAFYQKVPLIVLTADRPVEWIDQGDGQTIRQKEVFRNYVKASFELPERINSKDELWYNDRLISEALNACYLPQPGPVHLNLPFTEPLYGFPLDSAHQPKAINTFQTRNLISSEQLSELNTIWQQSKRKMILAGQQHPDHNTRNWLEKLAQDPSVVVLTETTSNLNHPDFIQTIDRCLAVIGKATKSYEPDLLISFGGHIVSKKIKTFLRQSAIRHHWHIDSVDFQMDTFQHLSLGIPVKPADFLEAFVPQLQAGSGDFASQWQAVNIYSKTLHQEFLNSAPWSDIVVFNTIFKELPPHYTLHLANSTPVRYAQLFDFDSEIKCFSNRGTSGIDGCTSTAAGACLAKDEPTLLITGDLAFFYDSNALWNKHLSPMLRIIVINNQGGGIFRFIDGPEKTGLLENYFEARHQTSAKPLAEMNQLDYLEASNLNELQEQLPVFFAPSKRPVILEIKTPPEISSEQLKQYFSYIAASKV
jgi:2-succinyl-5-enolpyruvyl-6-hydroxy-3-cyclohexene-1-carboxylate synthase